MCDLIIPNYAQLWFILIIIVSLLCRLHKR